MTPLAQVAGVHFTGHLSDVRDVVASSDVCVVPLRICGGTRLKILEAMALGTPVVATSKGAEGLEVTDGVDILIADSPEAFAAAVARVMGGPALRERLVLNARDLIARDDTWDRIGAQLEAVLAEVVGVGPGPQPEAAGVRRAAWP